MKHLLLVVYLRLMIVSTTLRSNVPDALDIVAGGGGGSDLPPVGISPAKIDVESIHISASAIVNRFKSTSSYKPLKMSLDLANAFPIGVFKSRS